MSASRLGQQIDAIADAWLGYARPPARQAIMESSWTADNPGQYCSRCGESIGPGEQTERGCGSCRGRGPVADAVVRLGPYVDELRSWVIDTKFGGWVHMGEALGGMLGEAVQKSALVNPDQGVVVPSPMPWQRRLYRGVDHARLLAAGVAATIGCPMLPLFGRRNGMPQVALSRSERQRQGGRGLFIRRSCRGLTLKGQTVVLVDDVRTTGSTLRALRRAIEPMEPDQIVAAVVAVSDDRARRSQSGVTRPFWDETDQTPSGPPPHSGTIRPPEARMVASHIATMFP